MPTKKEMADTTYVPFTTRRVVHHEVDPMEVERDDPLDLSGLNVEVIRNWVQLQKIAGKIDNKVRAMVMLLAQYDSMKSDCTKWKQRALAAETKVNQ